MGLRDYHRKRDFAETPEPEGSEKARGREHPGLAYLIHKHAATRLHYDLRLELDGVLKSWAVPKGPSLDSTDKHLAVEVEDHPLDYGSFEGTIPAGQYGGGTVLLWDRGTWEPVGDPHQGLAAGKLRFVIHGEKLQGAWVLVLMKGPRSANEKKRNWLLIKEKDEEARSAKAFSITQSRPESVATGRTLEEIADAVKAPLPDAFSPALATMVREAPAGDEWLHEIKFDGYRALAFIAGGKARIVSRNGKDWTERFGPLALAAAALPVREALLDGEVVVLRPDGTTSFSGLQAALAGGRDRDLTYYLFDLLHRDGRDMTRVPLVERKRALAALLREVPGPLRLSTHVEGQGREFFLEACKHGLEGVVSKRADSPYTSGRGRDWVKAKCTKSQEFVIAGYTGPSKGGSPVAALLLGVHDERGRLVYAGRVGSGFTDAVAADLQRKLARLEQEKSPFAVPPPRAVTRGARWVAPRLIADVNFAEWTPDGVLRHPAFKGLREDKAASEIVREQPMPRAAEVKAAVRGSVSVAGVRLTHPDRVLYPDSNLTKLALARYYEDIASWVLPHVANRPLSLLRCPDGVGKPCFFQKHIAGTMPEHIHGIEIEEKEGNDTSLYVDSLAGIVTLVQMGVLEIHPWGSRVDDVERPDRITFDLDPDPALPWSRVVAGAHLVREHLSAIGLESFVKTTGGKGLHVVVPVRRRLEWEAIKAFSKQVVERIVRERPKEYTSRLSLADRRGRIFIDYLRNGRGATAVSAYSTRARAGAPVSTPLSWDELGPDARSSAYHVLTLPDRLARLAADPWAGFAKSRQSVTKEMVRVVSPSPLPHRPASLPSLRRSHRR